MRCQSFQNKGKTAITMEDSHIHLLTCHLSLSLSSSLSFSLVEHRKFYRVLKSRVEAYFKDNNIVSFTSIQSFHQFPSLLPPKLSLSVDFTGS